MKDLEEKFVSVNFVRLSCNKFAEEFQSLTFVLFFKSFAFGALAFRGFKGALYNSPCCWTVTKVGAASMRRWFSLAEMLHMLQLCAICW